jgi:mannose-6-phosphate isomerase-like protein (cupin superfamily)
MNDVTVKRVDELERYQGPHAIPGMQFLYAARDLGVTAWGMNVLKLEPHCGNYPEHDHTADGQEEVYVLLQGSATLWAGERQWPLEPGSLARVGPKLKRKIVPGPKGATVLAIGATPGKAYGSRP